MNNPQKSKTKVRGHDAFSYRVERDGEPIGYTTQVAREWWWWTVDESGYGGRVAGVRHGPHRLQRDAVKALDQATST